MSARILSIFSLIFAPLLLSAQQSQISGPVSGYVFDASAHGLRPVLGMPGAALLGDPLDFGLEAASVWVAPRQDAAFVTGAGGMLHFFRIQAGVPAEVAVNGLAGAPDRVVFSPSGSAAALLTNGGIQILTGLPDSPAISATADASAFRGPVSLALSDDGGALLLAAGNTVELFGGAADLGKLADTAGVAQVAFAPGAHDAAVVDAAGAGVLLYRNLTGAVVSQTIAAADDRIQGASALAFSADGQRLLIANASGQSVILFDLAAGARTEVACNCTPSSLVRMGDVFRLNEIGTGPLWLLDARAGSATLTFVPATASAPARRRPERTGGPRRGSAPEQTAAPSSRIQAARAE